MLVSCPAFLVLIGNEAEIAIFLALISPYIFSCLYLADPVL